MKFISLLNILFILFIQFSFSSPTPPEIWNSFDSSLKNTKEKILFDKVVEGVRYKDSYISVYFKNEEIRIFCKYAVKDGIKNAPGLMNTHGWMSQPSIDKAYIKDGWAIMSYDYCGYVKNRNRKHYTKYPEALRHGNMDREAGPPRWSHYKDRSSISDYTETSDYMWYVMQRKVLTYFLQQKEVDATRIGAKGYSYGGTIMWNLGMDKRIKAIVAYFGIGWNEYYRSNSVWMYNVPHRAPKKTPGQEIYLKSIAPQAHAPYIHAASLWLNGTNDHHGGHERGEKTFDLFQKDVPWSYALQARGHHNTEKIEQNTKLWLNKHVLGKKINWPKQPITKIQLDQKGVPYVKVTPDLVKDIQEVKVYYAQKSPVSFARSWRDVTIMRKGDSWIGSLPVLNTEDYVFTFSNIKYKSSIVVSGKFKAAIPSQLGNAIATDKRSNQLGEGTGTWKNVAPAEGIGGIKGFRVINNHRGTSSDQFNDPKYTAPPKSKLYFKFYCTQPQNITMTVNRHNKINLEIKASNEWQEMTIDAKNVINIYGKKPMGTWSKTQSIMLTPQPGNDITQVIFADFQWKGGTNFSEE